MAKGREKRRPDGVFDRIRGVWHPDKVYSPKTTAAELDALEAELDFRFPHSYRAFAERFGLGGDLEVFPYGIGTQILPISSHPPKHHYGLSIAEWTRLGRQREDLRLDRRSRPRPTPYAGGQHVMTSGAKPTAAFSNLVVFADEYDEGEGNFLFQPAEVTDAKGRECRVFALNRAGLLRPVADSFVGWLEWVEKSYHFTEDHASEVDPAAEQDFPAVSKPDPPGAVMQYERQWVRDKEAPAAKDVKLWLARNNHAVRDLARSIRDGGQPEAFPVLADALQEAGCANADLLDSCRRGDPDIDGVWVLQVLLGDQKS